MFAVYSYVSPVLTDLAGLPEGWVTPVLALFGVGTTVGTLAGGPLGDRFGFSLVVVGLLTTALLLACLAVFARTPAAAVVLLVLFGAVAFSLGPVVQNGVIEAARVPGGSLVSAANQAAFNVANAIGAALGALVISLDLGYAAPIWVGAALALGGAGLALVVRRSDRRESRHDAADVRRWQERTARLDRAA
jgi:DHA1 family inner membrane transport protein